MILFTDERKENTTQISFIVHFKVSHFHNCVVNDFLFWWLKREFRNGFKALRTLRHLKKEK